MPDTIETNTENKEVTPEWATKLQETMDSLPERLSQALKPQHDPQDQQEEQEQEVTEIPLPQIPQPEPPEQESPLVAPLEQEAPKKKSFLGWLL